MASNIQHGVNITANDMKDIIESNSYYNGENPWQKLYGSSALSYQNQIDQLLKTYGDTIASAYKASLEQQNALYDLGLIQSDTEYLQKISRQELMNTYQNYLSNYRSAQNELANSYLEEKSLYDEALMTEADNYAKLYNSAMDYYENILKGATYTTDDLSKPIYSGEGKEAQATGEYEQKTTSLVDEYGLDWLMKQDADGNMIALDRNELMNKMFDQEGGITEYGRNFYDMVFNHAATAKGYTDIEGNPIVSFDKWLSDNDDDLYNWLHSTDTFNYTHQGTKLGSAKEMLGLDSTDDTFEYSGYKFPDKFLNDIDTFFTDIQNTFTELQNSGANLEDSAILDEAKTSYDEMVANIESGLGENYEKYRKEFESLGNKYLNKDNVISTYFPTYSAALEKGDDNIVKYLIQDSQKINEKLTSFQREFADLVKRAYAGE